MSVVPESVRVTYQIHDPECCLFLDSFDEPEGSLVLEVGGHDSPISTLLAESGFDVISIDLRPYDGPRHALHSYTVGDFGRLCPHLVSGWASKFNCVVCVSALEHFGLGGYGEPISSYLDVVAARRMYDCLRPGGTAYIVVPYGGMHKEVYPHWRVYNHDSAQTRIVQDFGMVSMTIALAQHVMDEAGVMAPAGSRVTESMLQANINGFPGIVVLLKLRKDER